MDDDKWNIRVVELGSAVNEVGLDNCLTIEDFLMFIDALSAVHKAWLVTTAERMYSDPSERIRALTKIIEMYKTSLDIMLKDLPNFKWL